MAFLSVNGVSILLAAVAAWLFGGAYYTALSRPWLAAMGKTMEQCTAEQAAKSAIAKAAPFILAFVGELIIAWAIYGILLHMNMFTLRAGDDFGRCMLVRVRAHHDHRQQRVLRAQADAHRHRWHRLARRDADRRRDRRLVRAVVHFDSD